MDSKPPFGAWSQANDPILCRAEDNGLFMAFHQRRRRMGLSFTLPRLVRAGAEISALPILVAATALVAAVAGPFAFIIFLILIPPVFIAWLRSLAPRSSRLPPYLLRCLHRGASVAMIEPILLVPRRPGELAEAVLLEHVESRRLVWILVYALFTALVLACALKPLGELGDEFLLEAPLELLIKLLSPVLILYTNMTGRSSLIEYGDLWEPGEIAFAACVIWAAIQAWPLLRFRYQERSAGQFSDMLALSPAYSPVRRWILHISGIWGQILSNLIFILVIATEAIAGILLFSSILHWLSSYVIGHFLPTLWDEELEVWSRQIALPLTGIAMILASRLLLSLAPQAAAHWKKAAEDAIAACDIHLEDAIAQERVQRPRKGKPVIPLFQFRRPKPSAI